MKSFSTTLSRKPRNYWADGTVPLALARSLPPSLASRRWRVKNRELISGFGSALSLGIRIWLWWLRSADEPSVEFGLALGVGLCRRGGEIMHFPFPDNELPSSDNDWLIH